MDVGNDDLHGNDQIWRHGPPPESGAAANEASSFNAWPIMDVATRSPRRRGAGGDLIISHQNRPDDYDARAAMMRYHPDLPFLVTHWLSNFAVSGMGPVSMPSSSVRMEEDRAQTIKQGGTSTERLKEEEALASIRRAASDLAVAFRTLGAYGLSAHGTTRAIDPPRGGCGAASRPATYADLMRKYAPLVTAAASGLRFAEGSGILDALVVSASSSSSNFRDSWRRGRGIMPWSLLEAAREGSVPAEGEGADERNVGSKLAMSDPSNHGEKSSNGTNRKTTAWAGPGRKVGSGPVPEEDDDDSADRSMSLSDNILPGSSMLIEDDAAYYGDSVSRDDAVSIRASQTSRRLSSLRIEACDQRRSMELSMHALHKSIESLAAFGPVHHLLQQQYGDDDAESNNLRRVVVQLERSTQVLRSKYSAAKLEVIEAEIEARKTYQALTSIRGCYRVARKFDDDERPSLRQILRVESYRSNIGYGAKAHAPGKNNMAMPAIFARQYRARRQSSSSNRTRLSVLKSRLSHAATISSHLVYPIYCLKFDRTGKYFITGADDQVAKVFRLGVGQKSCGAGPSSINYGTNVRGAILVCSLRGHAGVVADIDVSSDNAFLATASGDGDIRVWGLNDGWPVAILRGHTGGANMVSWSMSNPFQLVSCGEDGLARMWDIREAALKRYGDHYSSSVIMDDATDRDNTDAYHSTQSVQPNSFNASSQEGRREAAEEVSGISNNGIPGIEFGRNFGDFVANDHIDAGVTLIAQLHHGDNIEDKGSPGPVTRTGHGKQVKVMCIARSPVGGHFATGSNDGMGRVWADDDNWQVGSLDDLRQCGPDDDVTRHSSKMMLKSRMAHAKGRLLATLSDVHTNAVTDMKYSTAGDRILTASMKDGNVCIWSGFHPPPLPVRFTIQSQLCIQLRELSRDGTSNTKVNCDGVAWTCDDTKVITSQSSPIKGSGTDITPGSQFIYVWDSHTGKCLMGITSSHNSLCPSLAPHPHLPSVFASAGADGVVNVWDLDRGDCFCTHSNTLLHGPIEPTSDRGKLCGYLEAQFSPDGLNLVLTDESGRVIILDSQIPARLQTRSDNFEEKALQEQYFANDYYELIYDANGYCIERGSGRPPHLAPGGVRCTHEGVPYSEAMRETYRELKGPLPIQPCSTVLDGYDTRRLKNQLERGVISRNPQTKARRIMARNPDFNQSCETAIINKEGNFVRHFVKDYSTSTHRATSATGNRNRDSASNDRPLSNRYRWISFNDVPESEGEEEDQDDEEFVVNGRRLDESSEDERNEFLSQFHRRQESGRGRGGSGRRRRRERPQPDYEFREESQPARASSRQAVQRTYNELNSDDEALEELMSTHTKPSGKYVDDWNVSGHMFKLPRGGGSLVRRNWLCRTIYHGQKMYCPQVGDSVVYIPKAHRELLRKFWIQGYSPPWKSWPTASSWPVVRCKVTHARYRFPYERNYKSKCDDKLIGVSAILSLVISGVPSTSSNRTFPWPAPTFVPPSAPRTRSTESIKFEVTLFECDEEDFLIPEHLYLWKVEQLERAISANNGRVDGLSVNVLCKPNRSDNNEGTEDPEYLEFTGRLVHMNETRDDEEYHLFDSGYNALTMVWDDNNDKNPYLFSVWSISMTNASCDAPIAPTMREKVCLAVRGALHTTMNLDSNVTEWFFDQVDTSKYTDYLEMIEVPMHLSLIQKRLRSYYYTNKLSVIADMELLKENCYKYNEDGNDIFELACQLYDKFKSLVDAIEEDNTIDATDPENDVQSIAHDVAQAKSRVRAKIGSIEELDINDFEERRQPQRMIQSEGENDIDQEHQVVSSRPTGPSAVQNSQLTRTSSRATRKPSYMDKEHSESGGSDESDGEASQTKRPPPPRARSKPVYSEKVPDEEERVIDFGNENVVVSSRPNRRSAAQQLQLTSGGRPGQRTSSRARRKPTYRDVPSESSSSNESDGCDDGVSAEKKESRRKRRPSPRARSIRESDEDVSALEESSQRKIQPPRRARSMPVYSEKHSEEDEQVSDFENENVVVSSGLSRRSAAEQLQSTAGGSSGRRTSSRARRNPTNQDVPSESSRSDECDRSDDDVSAEERASQKKRKPPQRARRKPAYTEKDFDQEEQISDIENKYQVVLRRPNRRSAVQNSQLTAAGSPSQRTSLRETRKKKCEEDHILEKDHSESSGGDESDRDDNAKRRMPPRSRKKPIYTEIDSEDGDYSYSSGEDENDSSDDEISRPVGPKKRKGGRTVVPTSKRSRTLKKKKTQYPDLEKWHPVSRRLIQSVGAAVLEKLREMDYLNLFSQPVCEVFPAIAKEYLKVVKKPMDFRTIEEERMPRYDHISELQEDIILTFHNCCVYNGEISLQKKYCRYALDLWQKLNDVYRDVTKKSY